MNPTALDTKRALDSMHRLRSASVIYLLIAARLLLGGIFLRAGLSKLSAPDDFGLAVANYGLIPSGLVRSVARGLPVLEIFGGLLLLLGILTGPVAAAMAVLLLVFALAIAVNLAQGRSFDCGCSGSTNRGISWGIVAKDSLLVGVAVGLAITPSGVLALWPVWIGRISGSTTSMDVLPVPIALSLTGLLYYLITRGVSSHRLAVRVRSSLGHDRAQRRKMEGE